jgi:glycerol-3-phosphate dehydrogenase
VSGTAMPAPVPFAPIASLAHRRYDVIVIGGGINGAAIARLAAQRGRSVLLLEQHDYGWGTTWRSTKLIHGGLRYLEHAEFGLVFEAMRDQAILRRAYPDMVRPVELLLPVFADDRHRPVTIGIGLRLYDALATGRGLPRHQSVPRATAYQLEPGLRRAGLAAAFRYYDCQVPYPERLCLQTLQEARLLGAEAVSRVAVTGLLRAADGRVTGVRARDEEAERDYDIAASVVINAAGPWVDAVLRGGADAEARLIGGTKGSHIVVDYQRRGPRRAIYAEARSDHRPFFIVPWRGKHLVGTTDTRFAGDPAAVHATEAEIEYLLREANAVLPHTRLTLADVEYGYAGVRPLPATGAGQTGAITRRHIVHDHTPDGNAGLVSIIGGKLSTFRSLARAAMPAIDAAAGASACAGDGELPFISHPATVVVPGVPPATVDYLRQMYGPALAPLAALLATGPELREPICEHGPDLRGQLVFAARHEGVRGLDDALLRRTGVGWNRCLGLHCAADAAAVLQFELGWDAECTAFEVACYRRAVAQTFTAPVSPVTSSTRHG